MSNEKHTRLTVYILLAIVAAVTLALVRPSLATGFEVGGQIFLRLLTMMVVPLVVSSVMSGIIGLGDVRKLGRPGAFTVAYYLTTTVLAVIVGLVMVNLIQPGVGTIDQDTLNALAAEGEGVAAAQETVTLGAILRNLLLTLFTDNLISSAAETNLLPLIVFSLIFAGMLTTMGKRVAAINEMIVQVNDALLSFILLLMRLAPLGIFCLVTARFGEAQVEGNLLDVLRQTGAYFSTVLAGLAVHAFVTLPLLLWAFTRRNPFRFMYQMSQALLTAFSTASSTATLPVTMECAQTKAGVSKRSTEFVLPLGATINMDGTALYEAVAAMFIAQAIGLELGLMQQLIVAVTATLAAIGAAGIPEAGLVTLDHRPQRGRAPGRICRSYPVRGLAVGPLPNRCQRLRRFNRIRCCGQELHDGLRLGVLRPVTWLMVVALAVPALLLSPSSARAQVIRGYERLDRSAGDAYYATAIFDVDGAIGNSEYVDAEFSGAFGYKGDSQWVRFYPAYRLKRSDGENVIHDRSAHIRHSYRISERMSTFAFVQVQAEESIELERRFLIGGGIRSALVRLGSGGMDLGIGLMLDEERRTDRDVRSDVRGANLFSIYGDAGVVGLSGSIYFQPVIENWSDHRVLVLVSATVPLVAHVGLELSSFWRRDSRPPSPIEKHDSGASVGFRLDVD